MAEILYRLIERLDGEKGQTVIIPYMIAEKIKLWLLTFIK